MGTLYEITNDLAALEDLSESGEISYEDLADTIETVQLDADAKIDSIASVIKNMRSDAIAIQTEAKRLKERAESKLKAADRLSQYLSMCLARMEMRKWSNEHHKLSFRKSRSLRIENEDALVTYLMDKHPDAVKVSEVVSVDKNAVKKLIDNREEVQGAVIEENDNLQVV